MRVLYIPCPRAHEQDASASRERIADNSDWALWESAVEIGVDLHVLLSRGDGSAASSSTLPRGATVHHLSTVSLRRNRGLWKGFRGFDELVDVVDPDVIHVQMEPWGILVAQALVTGRPVVVSGAENMFMQGGWGERSIRRVIARRNLLRIAGFAGWNSAAVSAARETGLALSAPVCVVPAVLPNPQFFAARSRRDEARQRFGIERDEVAVGFVGRYAPEKGLDWLLRSFARVDHPRVRLLLFGDGPLRPELQAQALASSGTVREMGSVSYDQIPEVMAALDVLVLPSLTGHSVAEQFGLVVVEAMHSGVAVIASRAGSLGEVVGNGGLLVDEEDTRQLTAAIESLVADPELRRSHGETGKVWASERHSPQKAAERLVSFWERVAPGPTSRENDAPRAEGTGRVSVAALMTSHNRRDKTLTCLTALFDQELQGADLSVYLVDDASTDGTASAVRAEFPDVVVLDGSGDLFWSGGMRVAQEAASGTEPDFLLWLNDDVVLESGAVATLLTTHEDLRARGLGSSIVVGAMCDAETGETTYSGVRRHDPLRRMRFTMVEPQSTPVQAETMHGNLVLVPRTAYLRVGSFDPGFTHAMNDFDYGLRATTAGCSIWVAPGHLGTCSHDHADAAWDDSELSFVQAFRTIISVKNLPPRQWMRFTRRHGGVLWPALWLGPYARLASTRLRARRRPVGSEVR